MIKFNFKISVFFFLFFFLTFSVIVKAGDKNKGKKNVKSSRIDYDNFNQKYYDSKSQIDDPFITKQRNIAKNAISEMDDQQRYIDYLAPSDLNKLPIGFKKSFGNTTVKIAISSAVFKTDYAELTAYAKIDIPQNNSNNNGSNAAVTKKTLFFGIKGLKLSKTGGIIGSAKLVLLGDFAIPLNGGKSSLILKGAFDIISGQGIDKTYIEIDCNGFKELAIDASIEFPRSLLLPLNAIGDVMPIGLVKGDFNLKVTNWNDILTEVSLPYFEMTGLKGVGFNIQTAVIDLSDIRNSSNITYPAGYQQKYLGNETSTLPLWRGVYAKEIKVTLPKSFANRDSSNRVAFAAQNMIIDNNGLSGLFIAQNIIPIHKGSAGGWQFSVDNFRIELEANRLMKAGFDGRIGLPVNKTENAEPVVNDSAKVKAFRQKFLAYNAMFSTSGDYLVRVLNNDSLIFDVWKAKVLLLPNSYIELAGNQDEFKPLAMLHGKMGIESNTGTDGNTSNKKVLDIKGIEFQSLKIQTVAPYLSAQYFGYNGAIKLGNFPVSIDSIALKSYGLNEMGLGFNLKINLQDAQNGGFGGSTRINIIGKFKEEEGLKKWQYDRLNIEAIALNAQIGKIYLRGSIEFLNNHPVYGNGFKGNINLKVEMKDTFSVAVATIFGNIGYRYWFVDGLVDFPGSVPIGPGLKATGFGGGAYYRMKKDGEDANNPSNINYIPDSTAGLGLRASLLFCVGSEKMSDGQVSLELSFNKNGGMRFFGLYGYVKIMKKLNFEDFPGGGKLAALKSEFKKVEDKMKDMLPVKLEELAQKKIFNPTAGAKSITEGSLPTNFETDFRAVLGINFDFNNKIFHANFDLFVSTPGNIITGNGAGGRAGWAVFHVEPTKWYMHMGTPIDPIGLKIGFGPMSINTSAYFMLGHDLPAFPALPAAVTNIINQDPTISRFNNVGIGETADMKIGKGIAFGAGVQFATGDIKFLILYANFSAGMGFDVMIKDYSNCVCTETNTKPGFGGWYAQGQLYAYLQGQAGVLVKIGPIKKKIPIISAAAVAVLQARLPNPSWVGGIFMVKIRVLGGLINTSLGLKFSFGDKCTLSSQSNPNESQGNVDFDQIKVITGANPSNNLQNVSLYAKPELNCFSIPNKPFNLPSEDNPNGPEETFRPYLSNLVITKNGQPITISYEIIADGSKIIIKPQEPLTALSDYVITSTINYQKLINNNWVNVTDNGNAAVETSNFNFKSGPNPPFLVDENIGFMYPYKNQKFYHKNQFTFGRILLKHKRGELFNSFNKWKARFIDKQTNQIIATTEINYDSIKKLITYPTFISTTNTTTIYTVYLSGLQTIDPKNYESESFSTSSQQQFNLLYNLEYSARKDLGIEMKGISTTQTSSNISQNNFLANNKAYKMEIYGEGFKVGYAISDSSLPIYKFEFNTSQFGTFEEKINSLQITQPIVGRIESDIINLQAKVNNYEGFDKQELAGLDFEGAPPLIIAEADLDNDSYFNSQIKPLLNYPTFFNSVGINITRPVAAVGIIPYRSLRLSNYYLSSTQSPTYNSSLFDRLPFVYDVNQIYKYDYNDIRTQIVNKYLTNMVASGSPPTTPMYVFNEASIGGDPTQTSYIIAPEWENYFNTPAYQNAGSNPNGVLNIPESMRPIVIQPFPFMTQGIYKTKLSLKLPVSWNSDGTFTYGLTSPANFNFNNPIQ